MSPVGVIRPTVFAVASMNHTFPSTPPAKPNTLSCPDPIGNCVITPAGVIRPICPISVNHMFPSGPATMLWGCSWLFTLLPSGNSVISPWIVIRAIDSCWRPPSAIHRLWSGPVTIPLGVGSENSVITPAGAMRPTRPVQNSVNQILPSGPQVMPSGPTPLASGYLVTTPAGLTLRIQSGPFMSERATIQMLPSAPPAIASEPEPVPGTGNCVIEPLGDTRPTSFCPTSKYHTLPSGPAAMPLRLAMSQPAQVEPEGDGLGTAYSTTPPDANFGWGVAFDDCCAIGPVHATASSKQTTGETRMSVQRRGGSGNYVCS